MKAWTVRKGYKVPRCQRPPKALVALARSTLRRPKQPELFTPILRKAHIQVKGLWLRSLPRSWPGFIMAEVMAYTDLKELGSEAAVKAKQKGAASLLLWLCDVQLGNWV